jgi:hypothetical protein
MVCQHTTPGSRCWHRKVSVRWYRDEREQ